MPLLACSDMSLMGKASAGTSLAVAERIAPYRLLVPAFATAEPHMDAFVVDALVV